MKDEALRKLSAMPIRKPPTPGLAAALGLDRTEAMMTLPIGKVVPNPNQPRKHFSEEKHAELVLSIRERGVLQPIRVRQVKANEQYEIIAGERRWRAAKEAGRTDIPAIVVVDQTPEQAHIDALIENVVREDLSAVDRAQALSEVKIHLGGVSWQKVAKIVGLRPSQLFNLLGLTTLPENVQDDIRTGALTEKHGRALRLVKADPTLFHEAYRTIKRKKMSGDQAIAMVRQLRQGRRETRPRIFTVEYRNDRELIAKLKAKLRELAQD